MSRPQPVDGAELALFVEGEVTASRALEIEQQLEWCDVSRQRLTQLKASLDVVKGPDPRVNSIDLVPAVRSAISSVDHEPRRGRSLLVSSAVVLCLLVGAGASWLVLRTGPVGPGEVVRTKGAATTDPSDQWAGIRVWRLPESGTPVALSDTMTPKDALLFSYNNAGPAPYTHLMIFGVDQKGRVLWYFPEHSDPQRDPASLPITAGVADAELSEQVTHELTPGKLAIYGLFTRRPLSVSQVEAEVERLVGSGDFDPGGGTRLRFSRSSQHVVPLEVRP